MTCFIIAMYDEAEALFESVKVVNKRELPCGREVKEVEYNGKSFLVAIGGIGKVGAATMMQYVIDHYEVKEVISIGIAGGLAKDLKKNDVVICEAAYQHDFDLSAGTTYSVSEIPNIPSSAFLFDNDMTQKLFLTCKKLGFDPYEGVVVTGDTFIADSDKVKQLIDTYQASVCEMEVAALLQAAAYNGFTKVAACKLVSDGAGEDAPQEINQNKDEWKRRIRDIVLRYVVGGF